MKSSFRKELWFNTPERVEKLDVGRWRQIFYGEFDGRTPRWVLVKSSAIELGR